jgi:hypothetical protein
MTQTNYAAARSIGAEILERTLTASSEIALVCPYVTSAEIVRAVCSSPARSKRLVTRFDASDILNGSTDLACLFALVEGGVDVRVFEGVHAKVYILDDWAYVGSANLTRTGLADGRREFGRARKGRHAEIASDYFEALWVEASAVSGDQLRAVLDQLPGLRAGADAVRELARKNAARLTMPVLEAPRRSRRQPDRGHRDQHESGRIGSPAQVDGHLAAVARIIAAAIRAVPDFATSEHWTLDEFPNKLRLNVGGAELATATDRDLACAALPAAWPPDARARLTAAGVDPNPTPYKTVGRYAPAALRVVVPIEHIAELEDVLTTGLVGLIEVDPYRGRSPHRRAFSAKALRNVGERAGVAELVGLAERLAAASSAHA